MAGVIVAWVNHLLSRKQFVSERWWERKAAAYSEVMAQLAQLRGALLDAMEALEHEPSRIETFKVLRDRWNPVAERVEVVANQETFLISSEARNCLSKIHEELESFDPGLDYLAGINECARIVGRGTERFARFAHKDLEVARR